MEAYVRNAAVNTILCILVFFHKSDWPFRPKMRVVPSFSAPSLYHGIQVHSCPRCWDMNELVCHGITMALRKKGQSAFGQKRQSELWKNTKIQNGVCCCVARVRFHHSPCNFYSIARNCGISLSHGFGALRSLRSIFECRDLYFWNPSRRRNV